MTKIRAMTALSAERHLELVEPPDNATIVLGDTEDESAKNATRYGMYIRTDSVIELTLTGPPVANHQQAGNRVPSRIPADLRAKAARILAPDRRARPPRPRYSK